MKKSFLWIAVILTYSCNPLKKIAKAKETLDKYGAGAAYCAERFPVKDSIITNDSVHYDTLYIESEPKIETEVISDTVFRTLFFPGTTQFITKTVYKDSIIYKRDIARETDLSNQLRDALTVNKDAIAQRDKQKHLKVRYMWWAGGLALFIILYLVIGYYLGKLRAAKKIIQSATQSLK